MTSQYFIDKLDDIIGSAQELKKEMLARKAIIETSFKEAAETLVNPPLPEYDDIYENAEQYARVGDEEVKLPEEPHPMDFMFEGTDNEPEDDEEVTPEHVRTMLANAFGSEKPPKLDDQALNRAIQNAKGQVVKLEAAATVLFDKMQSEHVRSPGGLFIVLCKAPNIEAQAKAIQSRSPEQQYSEATRAAKKKMDEKILGRNLRGNKPDATRANRFKGLAEGVGTSSGA